MSSAYIFRAALLCCSCGQRKMAALPIPPGADPANESSWDSDAYPKGPVAVDASDHVECCASGEECLGNSVDLARYGLSPDATPCGSESRFIGEDLTDELTPDGQAAIADFAGEADRTTYGHALLRYYRSKGY